MYNLLNNLWIESLSFNSDIQLKNFFELFIKELGFDSNSFDITFEGSIDNDDNEINVFTQFEYDTDYGCFKVRLTF